MNPYEIRRALREQIAEIPIFDTHEHLQGEVGERLTDEAKPMNLFDLLSSAYVQAFWVQAGVPDVATITSSAKPPAERWAALKPYMDRFAACSTFVSFLRAFRDIYEFHDPDITDRNWEPLSRRIEERYSSTPRVAWLEHVLTWARVTRFIGNVTMPYFTETLPLRPPKVADFERRFFIPSPRVDAFLMGCYKEKSESGNGRSSNDRIRDLLHLTKETMKASYRTFDEYLAFVDQAFQIYKKNNIAAIKVTIAYWRTLEIHSVDESEARRIFDLPDGAVTPDLERRFQDFMMAHLARKARDHGWPFHIHTGWGNTEVMLGNPALLCSFIRRPEFSRLRFVLFHGYPFVSEFLTVAKTHPINVYLDMVWMPFLSMKASEQFLAEMLDAISCNKTTFGCDVATPEHTYGTAELGRDLLAKVLAERIADGYLTERLALRIAHMLLHENAEQLYPR